MLTVELAVEVDPEDSRLALPYLDVGAGGYLRRVLLDSGAARSSITAPESADTWAVEAHGTGAFGIVGEEAERRWKALLSVGDTKLGDFEICDESAASGRELLGQDVLTHYRCHYRLAAGSLTLSAPDRVPDPNRDIEGAMPIHLGENGHVYLDADWPGGQHGSAVFDTGASITVIDAAWAAEHTELLTPVGSSIGTDASGTSLETPMVELAGPTILGHAFATSIAAIVDLDGANQTISRRMDLILGWPLLSQVEWIIDHPAGIAAAWPPRSTERS